MAAPRRLIPALLLLLLLLVGGAILVVMLGDSATDSGPDAPVLSESQTGSKTAGHAERNAVRRGPTRERVGAAAWTDVEGADESEDEPEDAPTPDTPTRSIRVRVVRSDGGPVRDAHVSAFAAFMRTPAVEISATTDVDGTATLDVTQLAQFRVRAWTQDAAGVSGLLSIDVGKSGDVSIHMEPARSVTGVVTSRESGPLPWARVEISLATDDAFGLRLRATTDRDGAFDLGMLPEERLRQDGTSIRASASGHATLSAPFSEFAEDAEVRLELERGQTVRGRFINTAGAPVGGVSVWGPGHFARSSADGTFELSGVPWTGETMHIKSASHAMPKPVALPAGVGEIDLGDIVLEDGVQITGFVFDAEGNAVSGAQVNVLQPEWGQIVANTQTNDRGEFVALHVGEGEYTLTASGVIGGWTSSVSTTVPGIMAGATGVRIVLSGGRSLLITFRNESDRAQITVASAEVDVWRTGVVTERRAQAWAGASIQTVRIPFTEAGTYSVEISVPGYEPATMDNVEIFADRETRVDALLRAAAE